MFFPLAPGIESIWEPFQEEVEARVQEVQQQLDDVMDGMLLPADNAELVCVQVPALHHTKLTVVVSSCLW